jgi:hypothetical protein
MTNSEEFGLRLTLLFLIIAMALIFTGGVK